MKLTIEAKLADPGKESALMRLIASLFNVAGNLDAIHEAVNAHPMFQAYKGGHHVGIHLRRLAFESGTDRIIQPCDRVAVIEDDMPDWSDRQEVLKALDPLFLETLAAMLDTFRQGRMATNAKTLRAKAKLEREAINLLTK